MGLNLFNFSFIEFLQRGGESEVKGKTLLSSEIFSFLTTQAHKSQMIKWMASPLTDPNSMLSLLVLVLLENWYILKMNNYCQECYRGNEYVSKFQLSICHISWQYLWHVTLSRAAPAALIPSQSCITFHHQWKFKYSNGNDTSFCIGVMVSWDLGWTSLGMGNKI